MADDDLNERFAREAANALPMATGRENQLTGESLFEGIMLQRATLRRDQQLAEWALVTP